MQTIIEFIRHILSFRSSRHEQKRIMAQMVQAEREIFGSSEAAVEFYRNQPSYDASYSAFSDYVDGYGKLTPDDQRMLDDLFSGRIG